MVVGPHSMKLYPNHGILDLINPAYLQIMTIVMKECLVVSLGFCVSSCLLLKREP